MNIPLTVTPAQHRRWLQTFGHVHRDTIKLIDRHKMLLEAIVSAPNEDQRREAINAAEKFLKSYGE